MGIYLVHKVSSLKLEALMIQADGDGAHFLCVDDDGNLHYLSHGLLRLDRDRMLREAAINQPRLVDGSPFLVKQH